MYFIKYLINKDETSLLPFKKKKKKIENLYLSSKTCVGIDGQLSEYFSIKKGVWQGCLLSSILFNLFINDILNDCDKYGVPIGVKRCCGGLFADAIVL
jgi:hypothetical protein